MIRIPFVPVIRVPMPWRQIAAGRCGRIARNAWYVTVGTTMFAVDELRTWHDATPPVAALQSLSPPATVAEIYTLAIALFYGGTLTLRMSQDVARQLNALLPPGWPSLVDAATRYIRPAGATL